MKFDIKTVLEINCPTLKKYGKQTDVTGYYDCPFCGKQKKFHIDNKKGVFRCNVCQEAGGILQLHQKLANLSSTKEAYDDLNKRIASLSKEEKEELSKKQAELSSYVENKEHILHADMLDLFYKNFLNQLVLKKEHYEDLKRRGLSDCDIESGLYRSCPSYGRVTFVENALIKSINIDSSEKALNFWKQKFNELGGMIPGVYFEAKNNCFKMVKLQNGYFIPVKDIQGRITALRIRLNKPNDLKNEKLFSKYIWFSSKNMPLGCGVSNTNQIHYVGFDSADETPETVCLTEGELKAIISSKYSSKAFLSVAGVNNTSKLPEVFKFLKSHGTKKIAIAIDMDYKTNVHVANARAKIKEIIETQELEAILLNWDEKYKGIDDYLFNNKKSL